MFAPKLTPEHLDREIERIQQDVELVAQRYRLTASLSEGQKWGHLVAFILLAFAASGLLALGLACYLGL
jgi:energy-coupling factor transporter ATP-binding protein EcfA2